MSYGPWFTASYDGECTECGWPFDSGDEIRSDGKGGWLAAECGDGDDDDR